MSKWITVPKSFFKAAMNIVSSVGPYFVAQSESASKAFAAHKERMAIVDVGKELLQQEVRTYSEVKKKLLADMVKATPEKRIGIIANLENIERSLRQLHIGVKALDYLPAPSVDTPESESELPTAQTEATQNVTGHWLDKFSELARAQNEPWRADLLARALAKESTSPGSIPPRALWIIGTLEEQMFHSFASILDLSSRFGAARVIAGHYDFVNHVVDPCLIGPGTTIGTLVYLTDEAGLLADQMFTTITMPKKTDVIVGYGSRFFKVDCSGEDLNVGGIVLTSSGEAIASLYEPKDHPLGQKIFEQWYTYLDKTKFPCEPVVATSKQAS